MEKITIDYPKFKDIPPADLVKIYKVLALAERGEDGEKENAQIMIDTFCAKYQLTQSELKLGFASNEQTKGNWQNTSGNTRSIRVIQLENLQYDVILQRLVRAIVVHVTGVDQPESVLELKYIRYGAELYLSDDEFTSAIELVVEHYENVQRWQSITGHAYLMAANLYPNNQLPFMDWTLYNRDIEYIRKLGLDILNDRFKK